jgi:signal transduction histidine kinase
MVAATPGFPQSVIGPTALTAVNGPRVFERTIPSDEEPMAVRLYAAPAGDGKIVVTGVAFDDQRATLSALRVELAVSLPIAVGLALGAGWLVGRAAMRPVEQMRLEAEAISESDLDRRLPVPSTRDELEALGRSLNRMLERLEAAVTRERRLVDDASHELRTPLANLKGELELALRRARTEPELLDALRSALVETDRLGRLAADLLVLARAERGRLPVHLETCEVAALVAESVDRAAVPAASQGVDVDVAVASGLSVRLDPARMAQALDNMIDNALRQSSRDGRVTISAAITDGALRLAVIDTGRGFPSDFLNRAFEPFSRGDLGRSRGDGGAGLGLAIVQAVAEAHGGTVRAANRPEGGAIVEVSIPV